MALKTVAVEITKWEAVALIGDAQRNLGRLYAEYNERENFQFLIDQAQGRSRQVAGRTSIPSTSRSEFAL
jgi:hypothetical protein